MLLCMRTTVDIEDAVLDRARRPRRRRDVADRNRLYDVLSNDAP